MKNGVPIPGANAASYITPPTTLADDGAMFTFLVANDFSTNQCSAVLRVRPATALSMTHLGGVVMLTWQGPAGSVLQQASSVTGPWVTSANQSNPQNVSLTGSARYFRLCSGCP